MSFDLIPEHALDEARAALPPSDGARLRAHLIATGAVVPNDGREPVESARVRALSCLTLDEPPRAVPRTTTAADLDAAIEQERILAFCGRRPDTRETGA